MTKGSSAAYGPLHLLAVPPLAASQRTRQRGRHQPHQGAGYAPTRTPSAGATSYGTLRRLRLPQRYHGGRGGRPPPHLRETELRRLRHGGIGVPSARTSTHALASLTSTSGRLTPAADSTHARRGDTVLHRGYIVYLCATATPGQNCRQGPCPRPLRGPHLRLRRLRLAAL